MVFVCLCVCVISVCGFFHAYLARAYITRKTAQFNNSIFIQNLKAARFADGRTAISFKSFPPFLSCRRLTMLTMRTAASAVREEEEEDALEGVARPPRRSQRANFSTYEITSASPSLASDAKS